MATHRWIGAIDSTFGTGGNWDSGAAPTAGDSFYFTGGYTNALADGDYTASGAFVAIEVGDDYAVSSFGTSGVPMKFNCDKFSWANTVSDGWVELTQGGANANIQVDVKTSKITTSPTTAGLHLRIVSGSNDQLNPLRISGGVVSVDNAEVTGNIDINAGTLYLGALAAVTGTFNIQNHGGVVYYYCPAASVYVFNGTVVGGRRDATAGNYATITSKLWLGAGTVDWRSPGTIADVLGSAGILTLANNPYRATITSMTLWDTIYDERNGLGGAVLTNAPEIYGQASGNGRQYWDHARQLTVVTLSHP